MGDRVQRMGGVSRGGSIAGDAGGVGGVGGVATVVRPGAYTTLQDAGRTGYRNLGLTVGGALDLDAMRLANAIVGNPPNTPALECTGVGPEIRFDRPVCVGLCGGDFSVWVDDEPVSVGRPLWIAAGSLLRIGAARSGYRLYMSVRGGFCVDDVLGSASTLARFGIGGWAGRPLSAGDRLPFRQTAEPPNGRSLRQETASVVSTPWRIDPDVFRPDLVDADGHVVLRAMEGEQYPLFDADAVRHFWASTFVVDGRSDRMGIRLKGSHVPSQAGSMSSEPVVPGTVQVPPSGEPIVLLPECQTTGGYAKIATVIGADIRVLAQLRPGDRLRFTRVALDEAVQLRKRRFAAIKALMMEIQTHVGDI
jgi:antagonist of KipI